jgi:hypothetical protein
MATKEAPQQVSDTKALMRQLNLATHLAAEIRETRGECAAWYQANALSRTLRDVVFRELKNAGGSSDGIHGYREVPVPDRHAQV